MSRLAGLVAVALLALALLPVSGGALSVNEIAKEVRCPTCNTPLDVSDAPVARDMKQYIAVRIEAGWTREQIIDGLVDEFGTGVLATPPKSGFDLVAWIGPLVGVFAGLLVILLLTRAWARRSRAGPGAAAISPEDAALLDEELRRHDR